MKTLGLCFGATTMQGVLLHSDPDLLTVVDIVRIAHEGNPRKTFLDFMEKLDTYDLDRVAVTGRNFRLNMNLSTISEPEAVECAMRHEYRGGDFPDLVMSLGGETQLVYKVSPSGRIVAVHSGNKCASGTGEFFLQQIRRMDMTLPEAIARAKKGTPHRIAGRCSVFCKSDCTHALNKGEPRENIAAGLCTMMADKIADLVKDIPCRKVTIVGGGSLNEALVQILKGRFGVVDILQSSSVFEAFGAALWAASNPCLPLPESLEDVFRNVGHSFGYHPRLGDALELVEFRPSRKKDPVPGDRCILGLDVGSTTTKAVLMRTSDQAITASIYLRTNGNPVEASQNCYRAILRQIDGAEVTIVGLGVTGSGRQIAGLHALTDNVVNEIIAHATAAAFFDVDVDTIFEIGGQDAKYTYLTGGVPSDYAMNEACSAGTGSFLEESARESLNVPTEEIGGLALKGDLPPNFTDQCAAFISSDIKRAGQEGVDREDILAGLVYSICLNYLNRVKGSRPVGKKIFMQGGVCYNRAVPVAMASLMRAPIVVPPDPGLMGAFGVALEVAKRLDLGIAKASHFDLTELASRAAVRVGSFVCAGGREKCDRKCEIARIKVQEKTYAFGGICNKYYNLRLNKEIDATQFDFAALRQDLLFRKYGAAQPHPGPGANRTVGISRAFLTHSLYPLYASFFSRMGFNVVLSEGADPEGISRIEAAFCLPAEIAHGNFWNLIQKKVDYLFLPHVMQLPVPDVPTYSRTCVFVQAEPYFLPVTFRKELAGLSTVVLSPVLRMEKGYEQAESAFAAMAHSMGVDREKGIEAFRHACDQQYAFEEELRSHGRRALDYLDEHPDTFGIVVFGRPYSAFTPDANMGIPHKIASRGYLAIPHDMLPAESLPVDSKMYWAMGQKIMKAAQFVSKRENLFGCYITNFSCGPDSFIVGYFRREMGRKPSLTLELDQHTADAGIDTRIEAALDIIQSHRRCRSPALPRAAFRPARVEYGKSLRVYASDGSMLSLSDPRVEIVVPSMGEYGSQALAAVLRNAGIQAAALPIPDEEDLLIGRKNTTCKECLPYIVTTGSFLRYLSRKRDPRTVTLFFMATGSGPCRLGQYCRALEHLLQKDEIPNAAVFTMTDENSYAGLGSRLLLRAVQAIYVSDIMAEIRSTLSVAAQDREQALAQLCASWREMVSYFEGRLSVRFSTLLSTVSHRLRRIPLKTDPREIPTISLVGEIFVRREEFSRKNILDYLEERGFRVKVAPVMEYLQYSNYVLNTGLTEQEFSLKSQLRLKIVAHAQEWWERRIKSILAQSGLYHFEMIDVGKTIAGVRHMINENFRGECILTVGLSMREILDDSCGVISIGPFGCMPSRVSEAILKKEMNVEGKRRMPGWADRAQQFRDIDSFPFLALETDGGPFPQLVEANLEAFILQARRLHDKLLRLKGIESRISEEMTTDVTVR